MRTAPIGRTHSKRKRARRFLNRVKNYFKWHQVFANRYNITKFKWFNNSVSFKLHRPNTNVLNNTVNNDNKQINWLKNFVKRIFRVKKKNQPLVIIGIKHLNNKTRCPTVKIQYLKRNHWNTVLISNRTHKLKTVDNECFASKYNSIINSKKNNTQQIDHFSSLNQVEKSHALSSVLPENKLDIKYNYYYGTNALKTICIPLISGSTEGSSSNEFLEFNKTFSLKVDSKLLKNIDTNEVFTNNSHIRKRISQKYESVQSRREAKFKTRDKIKSTDRVDDPKHQFEIIEQHETRKIIFDPFNKT